MDRDAKLAAARKKLKQFKRKKDQKTKSDKKVENNITEEEPTANHEQDIEIKKSEDFIDETFELLHCSEENDPFSESTAATTESILQVSAKLNGIAEEAGMFMDGNSSHGSEDFLQVESEIKNGENGPHEDVVKFLESRNQELAAKLSSLTQENENLESNCHQLNAQLKQSQSKLDEERSIGFDKISKEEDELREQLKVQMQTIGVLVAEKQDLQQEVLSINAELHASSYQQTKSRDEMLSFKERLVTLEREAKSKSDSLIMQERLNTELQNEHESLKQAFADAKHALESEKNQSSELSGKLQTREEEYREVCMSHADLREKLDMADVLLQQMTSNNDADAASQLANLQQEKEALHLKITEYQQAFEQLSAEREQLGKQYIDMQSQWQSDVQSLQSHIQMLESRNKELSDQFKAYAEQQNDAANIVTESTDKTEAQESQNTPLKDEMLELTRNLEDATNTKNLLQEEVASQQSNNQYLSKLVQEKESRIYELENQLDNVDAGIKDHEQLLDGARSDKVTISRALLQNKQLKEQLEEIQEGFIRMSNDKMDLATQLSSTEHANKDLQHYMQQNQVAYEKTLQDLRAQREEMQRLQQHAAYLQSCINNFQTQNTNDNSEVVEIFKAKLETSEKSLEKLKVENADLQEKLKFVPKEGSSTVFIDMSDVGNINEANDALPEVPIEANGHDIDNVMVSPEIEEEKEVADTAMDESQQNIAQATSDVVNHDSETQRSMELLQDKFTLVMREKAELLNRLELMEHTNTQLQNECDTIGEYIALYHNQRQILKQRHREKDEYISTIIHEREAMQGKVEQLQTLIVAMLNNRQDGNISYDVTSSPNISIENHSISNGFENDTSLVSDNNGSPRQPPNFGQPDLVPKTDNSGMEETINEASSPIGIPGYSRKVRTMSETSSPDKNQQATAAQILTILQQMQKPVDPALSNKNSMPSGFCMRYIGPYTAI